MPIDIKPAPLAAKAEIADMLQQYLRELSPYFGGSDDPNAIFEYPYLDAYWQEPGQRFPYLILSDATTAGFAFVNRYPRLDRPGMMTIAEFYVMPAFRGSGASQTAANAILRLFPGRWELCVLAGNVSAERFWRRVMPGIATGPITEHSLDTWNGSIFTFEVDGQ